MTEPVYIRQTADPEHTGTPEARRAWFRAVGKDAMAEGATWPRYTISENGDALLIECWKERPVDEGAQRWSLTNSEKEGEQ